jgi:hypothetical protein
MLTLAQSLQGGANLILIGHPGSGKTVALSLLASQIARRDPKVGALADYLPLYLHALDIPVMVEPTLPGTAGAIAEPPPSSPAIQSQAAPEPSNTEPPADTAESTPPATAAQAGKSRSTKPKTALETLVEAVSRNASPLTQPRLPGLLRAMLESNHALLFLDGLDELPPDRCTQITTFLTALLQQYPGLRMVVATSPNHLAGLPALGLHPVAIADWGTAERAAFIQKWGQLWTRYITPSAPAQAQAPDSVDSYFLNSWLLAPNMPVSPLELTLKAWAAYAGDILGSDPASLVETYLRRMTAELPGARPPLELLAMQMVTTLNPALNQSEAEKWAAEMTKAQAATAEMAPAAPSTTTEQTSEVKPATHHVSTRQAISTLTNSGLLIQHSENRIRFIHPVFTGYLAAEALANKGGLSSLQDQPLWIGKHLAVSFRRITDISLLVQQVFRKEDFLYREQLLVAAGCA